MRMNKMMRVIGIGIGIVVIKFINVIVKVIMVIKFISVIVIIKFINVIVGLVSITPGHAKLD